MNEFFRKIIADWQKNARPMNSAEARIVGAMVRRKSRCIYRKSLRPVSAEDILREESMKQSDHGEI